MTLLADYQNRFSTQLRTNASNPQTSGATTPNTTQETYAAADAQADFEALCGVTYSSSNTVHVTAAVPLVFYKLLVYTGQVNQEQYDKQLDRLQNWYRLVLGRNRIMPTTNSTLTPSTEEANSLPWGDPVQFDKFIGNAPGGNTTTDPGSRDANQ